MSINQTLAFVDWLVYISLCAVSIYFIIESNVIQKYMNKNTDTYQTEIETQEVTIPDFVFCEIGSSKYFNIENNPKYDITYIAIDKSNGKNMKINDFSKYYLFFYYGYCFVVTPPSDIFSYNLEHHISFRFNSSIKGDDLPQIKGSVLSKNNQYMFGIHHDGSVMSETIGAQNLLIFRINEERTKYLPDSCRTQPILKYLANELINGDVNCTSKCWSKDIQYGKDFDESLKVFPNCEDEETRKCVYECKFRALAKNANTFCNKISYVGEINTRKIREDESWCSKDFYNCSHAYKFRFLFANPGKVTVVSEYLLYDFISTLGNVGGTLGIFIGFSFSGLISFVLNLFVKIISFVKRWMGKNNNQTQVEIIHVQEKLNHKDTQCSDLALKDTLEIQMAALRKEFISREKRMNNRISRLEDAIF